MLKFTNRFLAVLFLLTVAVATLNAATTRIVNNNANAATGANQYTTVQAAINAAAVGDTIQIVGSATAYAGFTVDRKLTIYGVGINPLKDSPTQSVINGTITLGHNVNIGTDASGSTLSGLVVTNNYLYMGDNASYPLSNITLDRNYFNYPVYQNANTQITNLVVKNCIFYSNGLSLYPDTRIVNALVTNNIFTNCSISAGNYTVIQNNLFQNTTSNTGAFSTVTYCIVSNNIFHGQGVGNNTSITFNTFSNNITFACGNGNVLPLGSNNNTGDASNLSVTINQFNSVPLTNSSWNFSWDPTLAVGAAANTAGPNSTPIGILTGTNAFTSLAAGATPPFPLIKTLNINGSVPQGSPVGVTIQAVAK
jgi:hypothetical protein